jgi:hypothetical protein
MKQHPFPPVPSRCYDDAEGTKRVWAIIADPERDDSYGSGSGGGYRHLRFSFVSVPGYFGAGQPTADNIRGDLDSPLYDLRIDSQGSQYRPDELYSQEIEYHRVHSLGLNKAERYATFLRKLEGKLDALRTEHGRVDSFAQYVTRICQVLKVRYLILKDTESSGMYCDGRYTFVTLYQRGNHGLIDKLDGADLQYHVRQLQFALWSKEDRDEAKRRDEQAAVVQRAAAAAAAVNE